RHSYPRVLYTVPTRRSSDLARDAHRAQHGFRTGVAERGAVVTGQLADQLRDFPSQRMHRADLVARIDLRLHRLDHELRLPAEQAGAETVERIDILVSVDVPDARALRALHDDLVDDFLGQRAEAGDHARVGHVRAMLLRIGLRLRRAREVAFDERAQARPLLRLQFGTAGCVDARNG